MRKKLQHGIIEIKTRTTEEWISLITTLFSVLLIAVGVVGLFLIRTAVDQPQDLRQQASVSQGPVVVTITGPTTPTAGTTQGFTFSANTSGVQTDGIQLYFNIITDTNSQPPQIAVLTSSGLQAAYQEVEQTSDGYLVGLILIPSSLGNTFSSTGATQFLTLSLNPTQAGSITFNFDQELSLSTQHATNPPQDVLRHITTATFSVVSPSGTPSPQPTPQPSPTPGVTPTPSPSPSPTPGTGGITVKSCNESCSSNDECPVNHRCYDNRCRLATNVSSTNCQEAAGSGLNRGCNQYCADTKECAAGYVCWYNSCRNPLNVDSTSCANLTVVQYQEYVAACNQTCQVNADCASNLRCYDNRCRLATNVSSTSCSPATAVTAATAYGQPKGGDFMAQDATRSATSSAQYHPNTTAQVSASPSPSPTYADTTEPETSALAAIINNLRQRGSGFPLAMIASGLFLIVLVVLLLAARRRSQAAGRPGVVKRPDPIDKQQMNSLQQRINELQGASTTAPTTSRTTPQTTQSTSEMSAQPMTPTATPKTVTPKQADSAMPPTPVASPSPTLQPAPLAQPMAQTVVSTNPTAPSPTLSTNTANTAPANSTTSDSASSAMIQRLKQNNQLFSQATTTQQPATRQTDDPTSNQAIKP